MPHTPNACPHCHHPLATIDAALGPPVYCAYCGHALAKRDAAAPEREPTTIEHYKILKSIGKGGMGEVFLAFDPVCEREIALKRLRPDFWKRSAMERRFLHEAKITAQLAHPSIIPIYAIHCTSDALYFTMPYVHGSTLREMIRKAYDQEKNSDIPPSSNSAIPAFIRVFLPICQAIAYAHSKGIIHRDLKPENVIIGAYGQVVILDWGLATSLQTPMPPIAEKLMGTVPYMAPEQALDAPASPLTDVFSLGVILYQILTLHMPFRRTTMKEFRRHAHKEVFTPPEEAAPYRDVPQDLATIVKKCLEPSPQDRYQSVSALVSDLEKHLEGRSKWMPTADLDINDAADWELRDHVLITEQMAITQSPENTEWAIVMISKGSFSGNVKLDTRVRIGSKGGGIGLLINVPEAADRTSLTDGYCCWLGTHTRSPTRLFLSNVEILHLPEVALRRGQWYDIRLEKADHHLHCYVDNTLRFTYLHHQPLTGTHVGLLCRDSDFELSHFAVHTGGDTLTVSCLAVPDAFFAVKDYTKALSEYRRIAQSFPGTTEGREALFRAGLTLLEDARSSKKGEAKELLLQHSLEEFEKLQRTPGAPLGWLGKSLVYRQESDTEEEVKCLELALRRYRQHPMRFLIGEQVAYRLHEAAHGDRLATYHFALLALQYLPKAAERANTHSLLDNLRQHWEPLYFIEPPHHLSKENTDKHLATVIAFWLAKPYAIGDILDTLVESRPPQPNLAANALHALIDLGLGHFAGEKLAVLRQHPRWRSHPSFSPHAALIDLSLSPPQEAIDTLAKMAPMPTRRAYLRALFFAMERALDADNHEYVVKGHALAMQHALSAKDRWQADSYLAWSYLLQHDDGKAHNVFSRYSLQFLNQETTQLHMLYGCWLAATEGEEIALLHLSGTLEVPYPRSWALLSHYLLGNFEPPKTWLSRAFLWERRQLYRQLHLYHHCLGNSDQAASFRALATSCKHSHLLI